MISRTRNSLQEIREAYVLFCPFKPTFSRRQHAEYIRMERPLIVSLIASKSSMNKVVFFFLFKIQKKCTRINTVPFAAIVIFDVTPFTSTERICVLSGISYKVD